MENLLYKYNNINANRIRSGSNKENQAPTGNLRTFKNHSTGPIGMPFKTKNSNSLNFHGINSLLRNQTNQHHFDKLNLHTSLNNNNNSLNINLNNPNSSFLQRKTNVSYSSDEGLNSLQSSTNGLRNLSKSNLNQLSLSINSNLSMQSNNHKLSDLYRPHLNGSSSSLQSYSSNDNSLKDKRYLPPPPKQNIMYHEQRYKTELCRAYEEQNNCIYGDRCMFAHGLWELKRPINRHPKYKTQKCVAFEEQGLCMFGTRCSFLHEKIGTAEEIVDSMLKLNKQTFPMPENPNKKPDPEAMMNLNAIDEQEFLVKSIDGMEQRSQFLTTLKGENLFDWTTSKPVFNFHPRSTNSAYENIVRLETIGQKLEKNKDKLLPDLTSLLVDDHADSNTLLFNDGSTTSTRLPIFEKITISSKNDSKTSTNESNLIENLNCSNNSSKSSSSKASNSTIDSQETLTASSIMSISSSNDDLKSMDFEIEKYWI